MKKKFVNKKKKNNKIKQFVHQNTDFTIGSYRPPYFCYGAEYKAAKEFVSSSNDWKIRT